MPLHLFLSQHKFACNQREIQYVVVVFFWGGVLLSLYSSFVSRGVCFFTIIKYKFFLQVIIQLLAPLRRVSGIFLEIPYR